MSYEEQDALTKMFQGKPLTDEEKELAQDAYMKEEYESGLGE